MSQAQEIKHSDFTKPASFELYLHSPESSVDLGNGIPEPRPGYVPDAHYKLDKYYDFISSRYPKAEVRNKTRFKTQECFQISGNVYVTFNRDQHERHIKGAVFEAGIREDLVQFLDRLQSEPLLQ